MIQTVKQNNARGVSTQPELELAWRNGNASDF